jgi:DNA-binding response OmpR family regulator
MGTSLKKILLVDDDAALRMALADQLELHEEFETSQVETGSEALEALEADNFDAVLLDVGLPDMDGREVCRALRRRGIHTPVIMLTALEGEADTILGLDSGANDYVTKPFRVGVLLARLRSHLRQYELSEDAAFPVGPYIFRPSAKTLHHNLDDRDISLSDKESAILKYLYRAGDSMVTCDTLYSEIWDYNAALMTHTLQTHIYRLRQKIEENPSQPVILVSEPGGYRLVR